MGRNGTVVSFPHAEQLVVVSTRSRDAEAPPVAGRDARLALQLLHRLGSFLKFLSAKKSCSPAVQMNSAPQSTHASVLSWNSIGPTSHQLEPARPRDILFLEQSHGNGPPAPDRHNPARAGRADQSSQGETTRDRTNPEIRVSRGLSPIRGAASCVCASAPALAWHGGDRLASNRTNAS